MSNLSGYCDYDGPIWVKAKSACQQSAGAEVGCDASVLLLDDEPESNPLQVGFWMDGDSLAPPCGCTISTIHSLLDFARVSRDDVLYDLGCGDGRVCLEACARIRCRSVGVEVEADLVERALHLISSFCDDSELESYRPIIIHNDLCAVLETLLTQEQNSRKSCVDVGAESDDTKNEIEGSLLTPSVIVLFLLPEAIIAIEDTLIKLMRLLPNLRIVCNSWGLPSLCPDETLEVAESNGARTTLYQYSAGSTRITSLNTKKL